ncbi:unnamed protein product [Medioppia subpectinata]|uniref:Uncharacterized protein n=1 Tax=Medioppia subpectinata TaxID=1979941 RepID=A0A7R9KGP1_9ACAR|nr:unnamed protein product [Medioppia subpectinata]CAG2102947.1 unnamed protein product [Medioppia subpectinata]
MTTNPILVLLSVNTLCPEVEDYWLPIPPDLKTMSHLKQHILITESIGGSADDIGLYLENGLLRDNTSIDCLRGRDYIEIRAKPAAKRWINSSADNTCEQKRRKRVDNECVTIDDCDDTCVGNGSGVSTARRIDSLSHILSAKTTRDTVAEVIESVIERQRSSDPMDSQSQASGNDNALYDVTGIDFGCHPITDPSETDSDSSVSLATSSESESLNVNRVRLSPEETLCSEVEDYWLSIPSELKTINGLKRLVMITESMCGSGDDIGLYLESGLLRDNTSICDVLRDRDRIEIRVKLAAKRRISSSLDNTSEHKRRKGSGIECATINDSADESLDSGSNVLSLERNQIQRNVTSAEESTLQYLSDMQKNDSSDPMGIQSIIANQIRQIRTDSSASVATNYFQSVGKVAKISDINRESDVKVDNKLEKSENKDNAKSAPEVNGCESRGSATGQHSLYHLTDHKHISFDSMYNAFMKPTDWLPPQRSSTPLAPKSCDAREKRMEITAPIGSSESVAQPSVAVYRCDWPDCGYTTTDGQWKLTRHRSGHLIANRFKCAIVGCDQTFRYKWQKNKHHLIVHPNDFPYIPWIRCPQNGCSYAVKRHSDMNKHLKIHFNTRHHIRTTRMSSNSLSISVSVKALRPKVLYWFTFTIPPAVKTITQLKQYILAIESIDINLDDVELYRNDGPLCDNSSIGDVIRDNDFIKIMPKCGDKKLNNSSLATCCICLDPFDSRGGAEDRTMWCNHRFHKSCIDQWLEKHIMCPLCRQSLIPQLCTEEVFTRRRWPTVTPGRYYRSNH